MYEKNQGCPSKHREGRHGPGEEGKYRGRSKRKAIKDGGLGASGLWRIVWSLKMCSWPTKGLVWICPQRGMVDGMEGVDIFLVKTIHWQPRRTSLTFPLLTLTNLKGNKKSRIRLISGARMIVLHDVKKKMSSYTHHKPWGTHYISALLVL